MVYKPEYKTYFPVAPGHRPLSPYNSGLVNCASGIGGTRVGRCLVNYRTIPRMMHKTFLIDARSRCKLRIDLWSEEVTPGRD